MGKKILVADSDSVVQQVVSYFLKLEGFDVEIVSDGVSAMEAIEKISPNIIIMTPVLPGLNGVEVSQFVRENPQYKAIPIIFLSESEEPLLNNIPDLTQKFGIVNKPIDPTKLVNTVKEYIEKVSAASNDVAESLKSIEELLGWDIPGKKLLQETEEVLQDKTMEGSFDIAEMLEGIHNVPEMKAVGGEEIPKQVRDDRAEEFYNTINEPAVIESDEAGNVEANLKSRITDDMIENMVRKIAVDIVDRVTRELVPDIAEREIIKEIERLKGIE